MTKVDEDESLLAMPVADYVRDSALPNPMEISVLIVPSEIVLPSLTIIWDDTKHIEKRVEMGIEYWECKGCGLSKKCINVIKALAHVCKEFGNHQHVSICTANIPPVYLKWYRDLNHCKAERKLAKSDATATVASAIINNREALTKGRLSKRTKQAISNQQRAYPFPIEKVDQSPLLNVELVVNGKDNNADDESTHGDSSDISN